MQRKDDMHRVWDLNKPPTPAYIIHEGMLCLNLATIEKVRREAGVEIIVALKANATWHLFPTLREHSDGATASSLSEARLVVEHMGVKAHTYAPIYTEEEIDAILDASSHITFNSLSQYERCHKRARERGVSCGLRVNPEYSTVETDIYNNCDHEIAFRETGTQAVSFTTGVPAALGASLFARGIWKGAGVYNVEQLDPDQFLAELGERGLPWIEKFDIDLEL